jgi:maleylpyruvate isomerase
VSVPLPDPVSDVSAVREATARLIDAVAALEPPAVREPSLLPGWTRGHLLTHLARGADGMVNLLTWARTGEETPMYVDEESRAKDIEAGAGRPYDALLADLRASTERLDAAMGDLPPQAWAAQVRMRNGSVVPAAVLPGLRLRELHLHHVDLDVGHTCADLPREVAGRLLAGLVDGLAGREGIAAVRVHDTVSGATWDLGAADHPELTVSGPTGALLAWVSGRGDGGDLTVEPELPLPVLPPLG